MGIIRLFQCFLHFNVGFDGLLPFYFNMEREGKAALPAVLDMDGNVGVYDMYALAQSPCQPYDLITGG